jgi:DNA-binding transcriptional regulator YhcF (GntR family)
MKLIDLQDNLDRRKLGNSGVSGESMEQILLLHKVLAGAGKSEDEIRDLIAKATTSGLSQNEIKAFMDAAVASSNLTPKDIAKLKQLEKSLQGNKLRAAGISADAVGQVVALQKALADAGLSAAEIAQAVNKLTECGSDDKAIGEVMSKILDGKGVPKAAFDAIVKLSEDLARGQLRGLAGVNPEVINQITSLQKAMKAAGASDQEIAEVIAKATSSGLSNDAIAQIMTKVARSGKISPEEAKKLEKSLRDGSLRIGGGADPLEAMLRSGQLDKDTLARALFVQKMLAQSGLSPEDMSKAMLLQKTLLDAGASPEQVARAMQEALSESGAGLEQALRVLQSAADSGTLRSWAGLSADDVATALKLNKCLGGASEAARRILDKLGPDKMGLLKAVIDGQKPGRTSLLSSHRTFRPLPLHTFSNIYRST